MEIVQKRRVSRTSRACENCRKRKIKCTGSPVCNECKKYGEICIIRSYYRKSKRSPIHKSESAEPELENKSQLEIPDYLSVTGQNEGLEYFGPASNFSFVNQLNHFLQQSDQSNTSRQTGLERFGMKPTVLERSSEGFSLEDITIETRDKLLTAFLETWTIPCPIFEAHQIFTLASNTWKNPSSSANDRALLYLILSVGASTSFFDIEESSPNAFPIARGFFNLAFHTVPTVFSEVSLDSIRIIFFMGLSACCLGDTSLSYIYSGLAVRILLAIGLHKNVVVGKSRHSFDSRHHRRLWVSLWHFEKYWSFCVGRPSCSSEYLDMPKVKPDDFEYQGLGDRRAFKATAEHMRIRTEFASCLSKIHAELYNSKADLLTILNKVEHFSSKIDDEYFNSKDKQLIKSDVNDVPEDIPIESVREWFWIRIYYLYIKLIIFRPFLIFSVYLKNSSTHASGPIRDKIKAGSDTCVNMAIELSDFIIKLNNKYRMLQPILFISTYLESASTVLLFYIVSGLSDIQDSLARKIWDVLQATRSFLNGSYGSYLGATKILAKDGLESLQSVLMKRNHDKNSTYFDKIMKPVMEDSPVLQIGGAESHDIDFELETFWLQTLDWISYS